MNALVKRGALACFFATSAFLAICFTTTVHAQDISNKELETIARNYVPADDQKNRYTQNAIDSFLQKVEKSSKPQDILNLFHTTFGDNAPAAGKVLYASCKSFAAMRILSLSIMDYAHTFFKNYTKIEQSHTKESIFKQIVAMFANNIKTSEADAFSINFTNATSPLAQKLCTEITDIFFKIHTLLSPFSQKKSEVTQETLLKTTLAGNSTSIRDLLRTTFNDIAKADDTKIQSVKTIIEGVYQALDIELKTIKIVNATPPPPTPITSTPKAPKDASQASFPPPIATSKPSRSTPPPPPPPLKAPEDPSKPSLDSTTPPPPPPTPIPKAPEDKSKATLDSTTPPPPPPIV